MNARPLARRQDAVRRSAAARPMAAVGEAERDDSSREAIRVGVSECSETNEEASGRAGAHVCRVA